MKTLSIIIAGSALVAAPISVADASEIVQVINYTTDTPNLFIGGIVRGPGRYRFQVDVTTPLLYLTGTVEKDSSYNFFCDFGDGVVPCGGDETPMAYDFAQVSPRSYTAELTVIEPYSVPEDGAPFVRTDYYDVCCRYLIDFQGLRAGTATLSITALPEPRSWMLLIAGFGVVGAMMRMRRSRARVAVSYA